jgi:hypothetical protein
MADIFISYAREDYALASDGYFLEARGYSIWNDIRLRGGDDYQLEIAKMIALAHGVIVIWSANSVTSLWVRAEAGLAHNAGKLVPTNKLQYDQIRVIRNRLCVVLP